MPAHTPIKGPPVWQPSTAYTAGQRVQPNPPNGYQYGLSFTGTSGASQPTWNPTPGSSTTDGALNWVNQGAVWSGQIATAADFTGMDASVAALVNAGPGYALRYNSTAYAVGDLMVLAGVLGTYYQCVRAGTTTATGGPTFPTVAGRTVTDGTVVWVCMGSTAQKGGGGTWSPSSPITINGQGLSVQAPLVVAQGGQLALANPGGIALGAGDYPNYLPGHAGRSRTIQYPCALGLGSPSWAWRVRMADGGVQALCSLLDLSDGAGPQPLTFQVPIRCHDGSTLTQVVVNLRVGFAHATLPSTAPQARVIRVDAGGNATPLTSQAAGADPFGYVAASLPGNAAQWTGHQTITVPCDQNNAVNVGAYVYLVEILEEQQSGGYPWSLIAKQPVKAVLVASGPGSAQGLGSTDGVSLNAGDRVLNLALASNTPETWQSGLWTADGGPWSRAPDLHAAADFSTGMIVLVDEGNSMGAAVLQVQSTQAWNPPNMGPSATQYYRTGLCNKYVPTGFVTLPSPANRNGYWYQCSAGGSVDQFPWGAGGTPEPSWPTTQGETVPDFAPPQVWEPHTIFAAGTYVLPKTPNGWVYLTSAGGTSGATEPSWSVTWGVATSDSSMSWDGNAIYVGPAIWTCMGPLPPPLNFVGHGPLDDEAPGVAGTQIFHHGNIYQSVSATFSGITNGSFQ